MKDENLTAVYTRVTLDTREALRLIAARHGMTIAQVVRQAIREFLAGKEEK